VPQVRGNDFAQCGTGHIRIELAIHVVVEVQSTDEAVSGQGE
jgi:hypothetical protein